MLEIATISLLNGIVYGLLLFMLTSGLTLIFSMMGVLNFAHASVFMVGAYLSYQLGRWVGFWSALVLAPLLCGLIGAAIERYGLRHVHKSGHVAEILFTFGLAYLIEELVTMIWGRNAVANSVPAVIDFSLFSLFGSSFPAYKGLMMAISIAMFVFLYVALKRTRIGLVIAVGSALAGLAGVIGGFMLLTQPTLANAIGPIVFVVVVIGGLGSLGGALIASMLIGILQTFAVAIDYSLLDALRAAGIAVTRASPLYDFYSIKVATAAPIVPYVLLVLMLIVRPRGLMGKRDV